MTGPAHRIAVDIGNSRLKLGIYGEDAEAPLQPWELRWQTNLDQGALIPGELCQLATELEQIGSRGFTWEIASVNAAAGEQLQTWLNQERPGDSSLCIDYKDFSIQHRLESPAGTGIDRWCAIAGVLALGLNSAPARPHDGSDAEAQSDVDPAPFIVVDAGTAVTVDLVTYRSGQPVFEGGSIFLGPAKSLALLHSQTAALPAILWENLPSQLPPLGRNTSMAILSGALYSLIGAIKETVAQQASSLPDGDLRHPLVVATGGASTKLQSLLPSDWILVDDLVLRGIQSAAAK